MCFYVQERPKTQPVVVLILKRLTRRGKKLKVSSDRLREAGNRTCDPAGLQDIGLSHTPRRLLHLAVDIFLSYYMRVWMGGGGGGLVFTIH